MYRRILIACDGSEVAERASVQALALARAFDASVRVVFVIDTRTFADSLPIMPDSIVPRYRSLLAELRKLGEQTLGEVVAAGRREGVAVETEVLEGSPPRVILEAAEKAGADLLVLGTHGRTGLGALLLGSTARWVVNHAAIPVLLVR